MISLLLTPDGQEHRRLATFCRHTCTCEKTDFADPNAGIKIIWGKNCLHCDAPFQIDCLLSFPLFRLLSKEFILLKCLERYFPFECTVGMNGRVWINSSSTSHTITIANAITNSEYMTNDQIQTMVKQLMMGIQP